MSRYLYSYTVSACRQRDRLPPDLKAVVDATVRRLTRYPEIGWYQGDVEQAVDNRDMTGHWSIWAGSQVVVGYRIVADPAQVVVVAVTLWSPRFSDSGGDGRDRNLLEA